MAKPGRKKKKKNLTIQSDETKIFFGMILGVLGLSFLVAPFFQATIFNEITKYVGYSSIAWGLTILYLSIRFFSDSEKYKSIKTTLGLTLISLTLAALLTFWIPSELLIEGGDFSLSGGIIGYNIHSLLIDTFGQLIEFIVLIFALIISLTLLTELKLTQIRDFVKNLFNSSAMDNLNIITEPTTSKTQETVTSTDEDEDKRLEDIFKGIGRKKTTKEEKQNEQPVLIKNNTKKTTTSDDKTAEPKYTDWKFPPSSLLKEPVLKPQDNKLYKRNALIIEQTLKSFNVQAKVVDVSVGPTVLQYALSISVGTKVSKIRNLGNDLALALAAPSSTVRIEAPIPGTSLIGIEVPNATPNFVYAKELIDNLNQNRDKYELPLVLGKDVAGKIIIRDLVDMPHLLVAGATGTGKSVGLNSIINGILMTKSPDQVRFILVDPKMVEMAPYNGIPHLLTPVITDMELVVNSLQWATEEMSKRYRILKQVGVRKVTEYNQKMGHSAMPYIVIIIDEMADLMLTAGVDVESKIIRLTQMSRAVGIHLILATQRPSVNVITGLIKANVPGRIGFTVTTSIDSRVIIDQVGAETLIGNGDMLFKSPANPRPIRVQGAFTDIKDLDNVVKFLKEQVEEVDYSDEVTANQTTEKQVASGGHSDDELFRDAAEVVINAQKGSASLLQRKLRIGYNRAARLTEELEEAGILGPQEGSSGRKVLVTSIGQALGDSDDSLPE